MPGARPRDEWLAREGGLPRLRRPLLDTSDCLQTVTLECPECAYRVTWPVTDPSEKETE